MRRALVVAGAVTAALLLLASVRDQPGEGVRIQPGRGVSVPGLPPTPLDPSSVTATSTSPTAATVGWTDNATNEASFVVEKSTDNATWSSATTASANATSASVTGLSDSTTYYFRVRALNAKSRASGNATSSAHVQPVALSINPAGGVNECDGGAVVGTYAESVTVARNATSTCIRSDGGVSVVSANQPCTNAAGTWLAPAVQNYLVLSDAIDSWTKWHADNPVADTAVFPDGNQTMDRVISTSNDGSMYKGTSVTSGSGPWTLSAWGAATSGTHTASIYLGCYFGNCTVSRCWRSDGTAATGATSTTKCWCSSEFGTSPARLNMTATCALATTTLNIAVSGAEYNVATGSHDWGGAQLVDGSDPGLLVRTTGAAASSTATTATGPDLTTSTTPSVAAVVRFEGLPAATTYALDLSSAATNRIRLGVQSTGKATCDVTQTDGGTNTVAFDGTAMAMLTPTKVYCGYDGGTLEVCQGLPDGGSRTCTTSAVAFTPSTASKTAYLGYDGQAGSGQLGAQAYGWCVSGLPAGCQ